MLDVDYFQSTVLDDPRKRDLHYHFRLERTIRLVLGGSKLFGQKIQKKLFYMMTS